MTAASPAVSAPEPPSDDGAFAACLEELTRRAMVCVATVVACTAAMAPFYQHWFNLAVLPVRRHVVPHALVIQPTLAVADQTTAYLRACVVPGVMLAMPVLCYQAWAYVCGPARGTPPPLTRQVVIAGTVSFAVGVVTSYSLLVPAFAGLVVDPSGLHFPAWAGTGVSLSTYVAAVMNLLIGMGLASQFPAALYFLARTGLVRPQGPAARRRFAIVGAFVYAAVLTPTADPFTQVTVALPVVLLWELGAQLARVGGSVRATPVH